MNQGMEFHDSELGDVMSSDRSLTIVLERARLHRSWGRPGVDSGTVWTQRAHLAFRNPTPRAGISAGSPHKLEISEIPGHERESRTLDSAWLHSVGNQWTNLMPAPLELHGHLWFFATSLYQEDLILEADHFSLVLIGEAVYVEELP